MKLESLPKWMRAQAVDIPDQRDSDLRELKNLLRVDWQEMERELREGNHLVASRQYFRELVQDPPVANQTTITGGTAITAAWDAANLTPLPANAIRAGQMYKVTAFGIATTAVTAGQTATFTPIFGTTTGGTSLGASIAAPLEAKVFTNTQWFAQMYVHFRTTGAAGTAICAGNIAALPFVGVAAGTAEGGTVPFGSTAAVAVNTTVAGGLLLAITPSLATQSWTTLGVAMEALN